jgi:glycosyltransferase involved in cell wall biosynthesis
MRRAGGAATVHGPRVLVVPSSYFPRERTVGGGERYAFEYARALARLTPTTLALFDEAPARSTEDHLEIRTFAVREARERLFSPLTAAARRELASYDVVHLMVFPTPLTDFLTLLSKIRGQTVVLTDVGGGVPCLSTYLQQLHPRLGLSRLADGLALLSEHSAGHFVAWKQPRVLLYGGAEPPASDATSRDRAGEYALFVGRLLPHKGVLELIEAIEPEIPLRVIGRPYEPSYFALLRSAAEGKRVEFHTSVSDVELLRHYLGARLVLQPSLPVREGPRDTSELLGLVTLEGMAAGKPVVVTRTGSLPELVQDGVTGFVVDPGDRLALGNRVATLMNDPDLADRMGEAARDRVERYFTWDRVARRGLDFYASLKTHGDPRWSESRCGRQEEGRD